MGRFVQRHLNSWDEICFDDSARLRMNVVLFTFTISLVYFSMAIRTALTIGPPAALPTVLLGVISSTLFVWQFFRASYSPLIAWLFGLMSYGMGAYFVAHGGLQGTGHLWIYVLPIVGTMMVPLPHTALYNGTLMALLIALMHSPLYELLPAEYSPYFRTVFPISMLIVILCNYVAEYTRTRTQQQLLIATEQLRGSAFTDPLTGAYNRRALTAHFGALEESAYGLSFAMLDLDYFKRINDSYGHQVGDRVLCHLVELVRPCMPAGAHLYRWGGEEFLLILKTSEQAQLAEVLEKVCQAAEHTPLEVPQAEGAQPIQVGVTLSIGGVCAQEGQDLQTCINLADDRMYRAKEAGRNRVVLQ